MRRYRPLIIVPLLILLAILVGITSFVLPKKEILGTWVSKTNPEYTWEFCNNGTCKDFYGNKKNEEYTYTISTTSCDNSSSYRSLFLRIKDSKGFFSKCYELTEVNEKNNGMLVLTDVEKGEKYYYSKIIK